MQALGGDAGDLNLGDSKGVLGSQRKLLSLSKAHQFHISWHARHTHAPRQPSTIHLPSLCLFQPPCLSTPAPPTIQDSRLHPSQVLWLSPHRHRSACPPAPGAIPHAPLSYPARNQAASTTSLPLGKPGLLRLSWSLGPAPATRGGPWCVLLCPATTPRLTSSTSHSPVQGADSHAVRSHQPRPAHSPRLLRGPTAGLPACLGSFDAALRVFKADSHHVLITEEPERGGRGDRSAGLVSGTSVRAPSAFRRMSSLPTGRVVQPAKACPRASPRVSNKVNFRKTNTYKPVEVIPVKKDPHCTPAKKPPCPSSTCPPAMIS